MASKTYYHQGNDTDSERGEFRDDISKAGQIYRIEIYDTSGNLYSQAINKWEHFALGGGRKFVANTQSVDFTFDGDSSHRDKAETSRYNLSNGNLEEKINWGEVSAGNDGSFVDLGQDKISTFITYASDNGSLVGLPASETVFNQSGEKIKQTRNYYDNLALGQVSIGNLTRQEAWLNTDGSYIPQSRRTYNQYGLVISEQDARGNSTSYQYDDFNLYPAIITNAL